jgi:hypothetical protein
MMAGTDIDDDVRRGACVARGCVRFRGRPLVLRFYSARRRRACDGEARADQDQAYAKNHSRKKLLEVRR